MVRWVSQAEIPSITPRSRNRTAYMRSLVRPSMAAIEDYWSDNPEGTEVTLAVLQALGEPALRALATDRSFRAVKQDAGLLVAQSAVDLYGARCVETLRHDTRPEVAGRRNTWADLSWVNRYTPHRLVSIEETPRVILDTSVVRKYVHGDDDAIDLAELNACRGRHPISVADTALLELVDHLSTGAIRFPVWRRRIQKLDAVLDQEMPLAPGGWELAALWGGRPTEHLDVDELLAYSRAAWRYVADAEKKTDLERELTYSTPAGRLYRLELSLPRLAEARQHAATQWAAFVDRSGSAVRSLRQGGARVTEEALADVSRANMLLSFPANAVLKMDLLVRVLAKRALDAANPNPYKAKVNDAIDFDLLFAIPLPAIICTQDKRLIQLAQRTGASDADRVLAPAELLVHLRSRSSSRNADSQNGGLTNR